MESQTGIWSKSFIFIIIINFFAFLNHLMILSSFPFYIERIGGNPAIAGTAALLFSVIAVLFRPFIGWMLDSGRRKAILIVGLLGMALVPIGYFLISSLAIILALRMIHGACFASSNTTTATIATDVIPRPRFAEGMGYFGLATALATACAPALGLMLMNKFGFGMLFMCSTGTIVVSIVLFALLRLPVLKVTEHRFNLKSLFDRDALPASGITVIFMLTFGALENFLAKYSASSGLPSGGLYFVIMSAMLFLTRVTVGKIADEKGEGVFVYVCNASMLAAFLLLAFAPGPAAFLASAVLAGFAFGGLEPALQSMAVHIAPMEKRGSANSTFLCAYDIGIGLGGGLAGWLIAGIGYRPMWALLSIANVLSVLAYLAWGRSHPSSFSYKLRQTRS